MVRYGKQKRKGTTIHPTASSQRNISKTAERFRVKKILKEGKGNEKDKT